MVSRSRPDQPERLIWRLMERIDRLETMVYGRSSSVTNGRTRFVGEESVIIEGSGTVSGLLNVIGRLRLSGLGILEVFGLIDLTGRLIVSTDGEIVIGNVTIKDGKITVGTGANQTVIDGANGTVKVGQMLIDPGDHGGMITLPNGGQVMAFENAVEVWSPAAPGRNGISVRPDGFHLYGAEDATSVDGLSWLAVSNTGKLFSVAPGVGGPGGDFDWPFPLSMVTSEWGPRDLPPPASQFHLGIDFGAPEGTPIPASGSGTVTQVSYDDGRGNFVVLSHGTNLETHYFHLREQSTLSVGQQVMKGDRIGFVGNTGASQGAHLHFETHVNGEPINPRDFMATHNPDGGEL